MTLNGRLQRRNSTSLTTSPCHVGSFTISPEYTFKDSAFVSSINIWSLNFSCRPPGQRGIKHISATSNSDVWQKMITFISKLMPRIIYFPNFLFDFPDRIYLDPVDKDTISSDLIPPLVS